MPEQPPAADGAIVARSRRRAKLRAARRVLMGFLCLVLLGLIGGAGWRVWDEVAKCPTAFTEQEPPASDPVKYWSVQLGALVARLQERLAEGPAPAGDEEVPAPAPPSPQEPPRLSPTVVSRPASPKPDPETQALLREAEETLETAWGYYRRSGPDAPSEGRREAALAAIEHFERTQKLYLAVLERDPPAGVRRHVDQRLTVAQRALFWTRRFLGAR